MSNCIGCTIRKKIENGCCVQGNQPEEFDTKILVQRIDGKVKRRIIACKYLDSETGECLNYLSRAEVCKAFNERLCI